MKNKTIKSLGLLAFMLGTYSTYAQSYGADINQNDGVIIRANNDNSKHHEYIRFQIGGSNTIAEMNDNAFIFNGRNGSSNIYNPVGTHVNFQSNRGINLTSNADANNASGEDIQFRVGQNGTVKNVAEMNFNTFTVSTNSRFQNNLYIDDNVGVGTTNPAEKLHVREGNLRVDSGEYQSWGPIILHPDVDDNGDDRISFRNSGNDETGWVKDGVLKMNTAVRVGAGASYQSSGELVLQPDSDNAGNDDAISFRNSNGDEKTRVQDGTITTDRVVLNVGSFPDYVFAEDYKLMPLNEVAAYIKENKHLPNVPSEAEVVANGMSVGQINTILVEKVEELTLHTISQENEIKSLKQDIEVLKLALKELISKQK